MQSFITKIKVWWASIHKYIWIVVVLYMVHLTIEGFAVNILYYQVIKPLIATL